MPSLLTAGWLISQQQHQHPLIAFPSLPTYQNLKHWTRFKEQETTATDNTFFLTDDDLRQLTTACKPDRSTKTALTILRSLNRVKEVRDGGLLRYALA